MGFMDFLDFVNDMASEFAPKTIEQETGISFSTESIKSLERIAVFDERENVREYAIEELKKRGKPYSLESNKRRLEELEEKIYTANDEELQELAHKYRTGIVRNLIEQERRNRNLVFKPRIINPQDDIY